MNENPEKEYLMSDTARFSFAFFNVVITGLLCYLLFSAMLFVVSLCLANSYVNSVHYIVILAYVLKSLLLSYLTYRSFINLFFLFKKQITVVALYSNKMKFLVPSGVGINFKGLRYGKVKYIEIDYDKVSAVYRKKDRLTNEHFGLVFIKGIIENKEFIIKLLVTLDNFDVINLKQLLENKNVNVSDLLDY